MTMYKVEIWMLCLEFVAFSFSAWVFAVNAWGIWSIMGFALAVLFGGMFGFHVFFLCSTLGGWTSNNQM